ncbi:hypothetical protein WT55_26030 [Burkholderia pseudomultivorans]|nr:hypothetical protein WT55_26030 [Burkholderia pseudomultivorans]
MKHVVLLRIESIDGRVAVRHRDAKQMRHRLRIRFRRVSEQQRARAFTGYAAIEMISSVEPVGAVEGADRALIQKRFARKDNMPQGGKVPVDVQIQRIDERERLNRVRYRDNAGGFDAGAPPVAGDMGIEPRAELLCDRLPSSRNQQM